MSLISLIPKIFERKFPKNCFKTYFKLHSQSSESRDGLIICCLTVSNECQAVTTMSVASRAFLPHLSIMSVSTVDEYTVSLSIVSVSPISVRGEYDHYEFVHFECVHYECVHNKCVHHECVRLGMTQIGASTRPVPPWQLPGNTSL